MENFRRFKFPAKSKSPIFVFTGLALTVVTGGAAVSVYRDSPSNRIATAIEGVVRSSRAIYDVRLFFLSFSLTVYTSLIPVSSHSLVLYLQISLTVADYKYSLRGFPVESDEYLQRLTEVTFPDLSPVPFKK